MSGVTETPDIVAFSYAATLLISELRFVVSIWKQLMIKHSENGNGTETILREYLVWDRGPTVKLNDWFKVQLF